MLYNLPCATWSFRRLAIISTFSVLAFLLLYSNLVSLKSYGAHRSFLGPYLGSGYIDHNHALDGNIAHLKEVAKWEKPKGMKIVGLVFYGRRRYVEILDCYLKKNLVENGGVLDEIIFVAKTGNSDDLAYLEQLIQTSDKYSAEYHNEKGLNFSQMYSACKRGNIYVKIDDDVLFIEDSTIRSIVKKKIEHPEWLMVSANLVVQFATSWTHYHLTAIHPYLPDLAPPNGSTTSWRISDLPYWTGPADFSIDTFAPQQGHRWLPLPSDSPRLDETPITHSEYGYHPDPPLWLNWMNAAQQHYSFLENLENGELWKYAFDTWDAQYERVSINLMAMTGDDLVDMEMEKHGADEGWITMEYSKQTKRHIVIDGNGIAVHNGYMSMAAQDDRNLGIDGTDILDRYRLYAKEKVCAI